MRRLARALALAALLPCVAAAGALQVTVLDRDGNPVRDAVVVLAPSHPGVPKQPLPTHVTIAQEKMRFVPALAVVAVGAKGTFINNDPWDHHVRATPAGFKSFDDAAAPGFEFLLDGRQGDKPGKAAQVTFAKPGPVLLGCFLHASMTGYVYVSDSPWALLTGGDGVASFEAVPDGPVSVQVWQADQLLDLPPQRLTLTAAPAKATLHLSIVPKRRRV